MVLYYADQLIAIILQLLILKCIHDSVILSLIAAERFVLRNTGYVAYACSKVGTH